MSITEVQVMSRRWLQISMGGIVLLSSLFFGAAAASASVVPLRATIAITEQVAPSTQAGCLLQGAITGNGSTTKLGAVQLASTDCINPLSATTFLFVSDAVVLTVDGGDQLWAAYGGTLSANNGAIKGTYVIIGGTGRFTHATGLGTIDGVEQIDFATGQGIGQIQLKGTLVY
jgi:hypothetical protein